MNIITKEQLEQIRTVCYQNGVKYYDVQLEAMDHIATMIENRCEKLPEEDFDTALNNVVKNLDFQPFYRENFKYEYGDYEQKISKKNRKWLFILILLCFISLSIIVFWDIGRKIYNTGFLELSFWLKCMLVVYFLGSSLFIAYKYYSAKYMLATLYKRKYWSGIGLGILFSGIVLFQLYSEYDLINQGITGYHQTVQGILLGSYMYILPLCLMYYKYIKVICRAARQYPKLYN